MAVERVDQINRFIIQKYPQTLIIITHNPTVDEPSGRLRNLRNLLNHAKLPKKPLLLRLRPKPNPPIPQSAPAHKQSR